MRLLVPIGPASARIAITSSGVGGSPVRSKYAPQQRCTGAASGASRAAYNASIGMPARPARSARTGVWNAQNSRSFAVNRRVARRLHLRGHSGIRPRTLGNPLPTLANSSSVSPRTEYCSCSFGGGISCARCASPAGFASGSSGHDRRAGLSALHMRRERAQVEPAFCSRRHGNPALRAQDRLHVALGHRRLAVFLFIHVRRTVISPSLNRPPPMGILPAATREKEAVRRFTGHDRPSRLPAAQDVVGRFQR